jgi:hypothetical protein
MLYDEDTKTGLTRMPLRLPAYGSVFVIFARPDGLHATSIARDRASVLPGSRVEPAEPVVRRCGDTFCLNSTEPGEYVVTLSDGKKVRVSMATSPSAKVLDGAWTLEFQAGRGGPENPISVSKLTDWSQSKKPSIRYFSGTAKYRKKFKFAGAKPQAQVLLQLTHVYQICTVRVNGAEAGTIWAMPYQLDITRYLRPGTNRIELAVTNLWPNRIIGDLQPGNRSRFTHTNISAYAVDSPLLPSGLVGPVSLITMEYVGPQNK